jgi:hypothetical protein
MSQSESSTDSTVTLAPVQYVEVMSMGVENLQEEEEEGKVSTLVFQEELEGMVCRLAECIESSNAVMNILMRLLEMVKGR